MAHSKAYVILPLNINRDNISFEDINETLENIIAPFWEDLEVKPCGTFYDRCNPMVEENDFKNVKEQREDFNNPPRVVVYPDPFADGGYNFIDCPLSGLDDRCWRYIVTHILKKFIGHDGVFIRYHY